MTQSQARRVIADCRADIDRRGWPLCEKRHLLHLINDLRLAEPGRITATLPLEAPEMTPVQALEAQLRKDRDNADGGQSSISSILDALEAHVRRLLPIELPKPEVKEWPALMPSAAKADLSDNDVDRLIARMRERRVSLPA